MFNFENVNWNTWIPSQAIAFIALLVMIYAMLAKTKMRTLIAIIIFNTLMGSTMLLIGDFQVAGMHGVAIARDLVFLWREKKYPNNKKLSVAALALFLAISSVVAAFTINWGDSSGWLALAIIIQITAMGIIFGAWAHGVHFVRLSRLLSASVIIANHVRHQNPTAILVEIVSIVSIIIFYIMFFIKLRRNQKTTTGGLNPDTLFSSDINTHGRLLKVSDANDE